MFSFPPKIRRFRIYLLLAVVLLLICVATAVLSMRFPVAAESGDRLPGPIGRTGASATTGGLPKEGASSGGAAAGSAATGGAAAGAPSSGHSSPGGSLPGGSSPGGSSPGAPSDRAATASTELGSGAVLRLGTFNIASGRGLDGRTDIRRAAGLIRSADLVGLNEVRGQLLGTPQNQADALGEILAVRSLFAPTEYTRFHRDFGNGVVSRVPVAGWRTTPLPARGNSGYRNVVELHVPLDGQQVTVLITHIDRVRDHDRQMAVVTRRFLGTPPPCVLMGDLNSQRDNPSMAQILRAPDVIDAAAVAGNDRPTRIDWILVRGLRVKSAAIVDNTVSDHPYVWADVTADTTGPAADKIRPAADTTRPAADADPRAGE